MLQAAAAAFSGRTSTYEALRMVLGADAVYPTGEEAVTGECGLGAVQLHPRGHRAAIILLSGEQVLATRGWAPFTAGELARVPALVALLQAGGRKPDLPVLVRSPSSVVPIVVRVATAADAATVTVLHRRRMAALLFADFSIGRARRSSRLRVAQRSAGVHWSQAKEGEVLPGGGRCVWASL